MRSRIFIVEDHRVVREGYALLVGLEPDLEMCGAVESAEEALDEIPKADPDLVLVDVSLPGIDGIELIRRLHARDPDLLTLVVSGHEEHVYGASARKAGARGYVMKDGVVEELMDAIRLVLDGGTYFHKGLREPS